MSGIVDIFKESREGKLFRLLAVKGQGFNAGRRDTVSVKTREELGWALPEHRQGARTGTGKRSYERLREIHERLRAFARKKFQETEQRLFTTIQ